MSKSDQFDAERACLDYLNAHDDFFTRHPELLERMKLPHGTQTVPSLLDKRMALLDEENEKLRAKVLQFIRTAEMNERLSFRIYRTGRDFMRAMARGDGKPITPQQCCAVMRRHFGDLHINILAFDEENDIANYKVRMNDQRIAGILRYVFDERQLSCGPFTAAERALLFGANAARFQSALMAGLGGHGKDAPFGLLILASANAGRFAPGLGTMFIVQLGELVETVLGVDGGA